MHILFYLDQGCTLTKFEEWGTINRELAFLKALCKSKYKITIFSWACGEDKKFEKKIYPIRLIQNTKKIKARLWVVPQLTKLLWRKKNTVLLTNQIFGAEWALLSCKLTKTPMIARSGFPLSLMIKEEKGFFSFFYHYSKLVEFFVFKFADKLITTNQYHLDLIKKKRKKKVFLLSNYVELEKFRKVNNYISSKKKLTIVFTGRLHRHKNPEIIIKATKELHNIKLIIIGDGEQKGYLEKIVREHNLPVKFLGQIKHNDLKKIYSKSDIFVLPSNYEGNPKSLLEAMASKLPVVASKVRGIEEIIKHNHNGLLFEKNNLGDLIKKLKKLKSKTIRKKIGDKGFEYVKKNSSLESYINKLIKIIKH